MSVRMFYVKRLMIVMMMMKVLMYIFVIQCLMWSRDVVSWTLLYSVVIGLLPIV